MPCTLVLHNVFKFTPCTFLTFPLTPITLYVSRWAMRSRTLYHLTLIACILPTLQGHTLYPCTLIPYYLVCVALGSEALHPVPFHHHELTLVSSNPIPLHLAHFYLYTLHP